MPLNNPVSEKIELISYAPNLQNTGDLEGATKTITATAEASGVGNADYSQALTLAKPSDARLIVRRIASRLAVTIDTIPANDTNLYCRVYVDAQDADHKLFDENWDSIGEKLDATSVGSGTIFNLLSDGAGHTFYFFFWKAGTGTGIVISLVQLWEGVGNEGTAWYILEAIVIEVNQPGFFSCSLYLVRIGSGTPSAYICEVAPGNASRIASISGNGAVFEPKATFLASKPVVAVAGTVGTDLSFISQIGFTIRSEQ